MRVAPIWVFGSGAPRTLICSYCFIVNYVSILHQMQLLQLFFLCHSRLCLLGNRSSLTVDHISILPHPFHLFFQFFYSECPHRPCSALCLSYQVRSPEAADTYLAKHLSCARGYQGVLLPCKGWEVTASQLYLCL